MKYSVVIPLYNKEHYIAGTLRSVLTQTFPDYEVIVVDDGSTDHSLQACKEVRSDKIRVVQQVNQGVSAARNKGIELAAGEYICFLDADDTWHPDYLQNIETIVQKYPQSDIFVTAYRIIYANGRCKESRRLPQANGCLPSYWETLGKGYDFVWTSATTVRRTALLAAGGFRLGEKIGQDLDLWARLARNNPCVAYASRVCVDYNRGAEANARTRVKVAHAKAFMQDLEEELKNPNHTFYLSNKGTELRRFKAKYYSCYVLPVLTTLALVLALEKGRGGYTVIALITGMELLVMDHSSTMMAQGQPGSALFGEYVLGRLFLVLGTLVLYKTERLSFGTLLALYVIQYAGILVLFLIKRDREPRRDISKELSLRKWGSYQRADLIQALISQMPILLQYFFTGAFEAGIVSVVLMVKKLVNFISGPTAKVFLPEFSRMYHAGDKAGIKQCYASIMRIQMLFAGSMAVVLVGYPQVLLSILAEELLPYTKQFVGCALVFILIATLGPCSGVLQMTGNEKKDNLYREAALGVMLVLLFAMRGSRLVMLYALCAQALLEGVVKYWYVCRWMQGSAVKLKTYCIWWSVPAAVIAGGCLLHLQHSALAMLLAAGGTFAFGLVCELRPGGCLHGYWEGLKKKFEKT